MASGRIVIGMTRFIALAAIVLAAAYCTYSSFFATKTYGDWGIGSVHVSLPFDHSFGSDPRQITADHVDPSGPAGRAGIVAGDRLRALVPHALVFLNPAPKTSVTFAVLHAGKSRLVTLSAEARYRPSPPTEVILFGLEIIQLALAFLLTLRSWDNAPARALIVYFVCESVTMTNNNPPLARGVIIWFFVTLTFVAAAALIRFASTYPSNTENTKARRFLGIAGPSLALVLAICWFANAFSADWLNFGLGKVGLAYRSTLILFLTVLPALGLIGALFLPDPAQRRRLRLLLAFFIVGSSGAVAYDVILAAAPIQVSVARPLLATLVITDVGFVYVILRHRLFDLGFVLNRAAVYAVLTTIFVPLFALLEWLAERFILSQNQTANAIVQVGIALILFMSIRRAHAFTEHFVDNWLFRERHENDKALHDFSRQVLFITDFRTIAERTVQTVCARTQAAWSALYIRDAASGKYSLASACGDLNAPKTMPENDPALVAMRTDHQPVDHVKGSVIPEALVLPLIARGQVGGFLTCGAKGTGELYAPDERDALLQVTHGVAAALDGVRLTALEREVAQLRAGAAPA